MDSQKFERGFQVLLEAIGQKDIELDYVQNDLLNSMNNEQQKQEQLDFQSQEIVKKNTKIIDLKEKIEILTAEKESFSERLLTEKSMRSKFIQASEKQIEEFKEFEDAYLKKNLSLTNESRSLKGQNTKLKKQVEKLNEECDSYVSQLIGALRNK